MKKIFNPSFFKVIFLKFLIIFLVSCSGSSVENGNIEPKDPVDIIPSNLSVTVKIKGLNNNNVNGDGSGTVEFTASATNAVSYSFRFGTPE